MLKLSKPYIPQQSFGLVEQILHSGNLVQGKNVLEFENLLAQYLEIENVILVSSGTAALHISLVALEIGQGDEVIIPAYSFPAVANAVELTGAKPVFVDISLDDYCIDVDKIEEKITSRTKAIMPVHEFGQSADMARITEIARDRNLFIVEDAACAIGTRFSNKNVGTIGDLGCFSFHPRKIVTTGEGGAIATKDNSLAEKIRKLRNHGMSFVDEKYDFFLPGFNYRMTDFQAAMGIPQLEELNETINIHRAQAAFYNRSLQNIGAIRFEKNYLNRHQTYQTYHILFEKGVPRDFVKKELYNRGIESNIGAYAMPGLSFYKNKYNLPGWDYQNAQTAFISGLALPIGRHLKNEDLEYITNSISTIFKNGF